MHKYWVVFDLKLLHLDEWHIVMKKMITKSDLKIPKTDQIVLQKTLINA